MTSLISTQNVLKVECMIGMEVFDFIDDLLRLRDLLNVRVNNTEIIGIFNDYSLTVDSETTRKDLVDQWKSI